MPSTAIFALPYPSISDSPNGPVQLQNLAQAAEAALQGPVAWVENTGTQSLTNATATALTFNSALYNPDAVWAAGSPTRMTAPGTGTQAWLVFAQQCWSSNATGTRNLWFRVNGTGTQDYYRSRETAIATADHHQSVAGLLVITGGDYVEVMGEQSSGGALSNVAAKLRFGAARIRKS